LRPLVRVETRIAVACVAVAFAASCAVKQPAVDLMNPETAAEVAPPPPPDYGPLYDELGGYETLYLEGIDRVAGGEEVLGEWMMADASDRLHRLTGRCSAAESCDLERFLDTFDRLFNEQSIALQQHVSRIATLEEGAQQDVEAEPGTTGFTTVMPEIGRTESLLRGTELSEVITLNEPVNAALDDWLTWMRPHLMDSYRNYQYLRSQIAPIYEEAGLPEALLFAMIATETGGKVHSFSRAGAAGPLQFMRHTGRRYGLRVEDGFDTRLDPAAATAAAVAYLNERFEDFNNSLEKALAAYNGGENRVRRLHRRLNGISLWDARMYYSLPEETREYVPRILAAAWLFMRPEDYNLEFPVYDTATTRIGLAEDISLGELTICLGQSDSPDGWFRTLRNLNPRLDPGERIKAGSEIVVPEILVPVYEAHCFDGDQLARARVLHDANYPDGQQMISYTVRNGDTLGRIASRHRCVSMRQLAEINRLRSPRYVIRVGQKIKIPKC